MKNFIFQQIYSFHTLGSTIMKIFHYNILQLIIIFIIKPSTSQQTIHKYCGTAIKKLIGCPLFEVLYTPRVYNVTELLLSGSWYLVAAGSNSADAPPPSKSCVTLTVTDMGYTCDCVFNTYDHKPRATKVVHIFAKDEENKTQVNSIGPLHEYPINGLNNSGSQRYEKTFLYLRSVIKSTICWNPITGEFYPYRFIVKNPYLWVLTGNLQHRAQYLYLLGINARMPDTEYHIALLANTRENAKDVLQALEQPSFQAKSDVRFGGINFLPEATLMPCVAPE